jgi:hypothetical protein
LRVGFRGNVATMTLKVKITTRTLLSLGCNKRVARLPHTSVHKSVLYSFLGELSE